MWSIGVSSLVPLMHAKNAELKHTATAADVLCLDIPYVEWNDRMQLIGCHMQYLDRDEDFGFTVDSSMPTRGILQMAILFKKLDATMLWRELCTGIDTKTLTLKDILGLNAEPVSVLYPHWSVVVVDDEGITYDIDNLNVDWYTAGQLRGLLRPISVEPQVVVYEKPEFSITMDTMIHSSKVHKQPMEVVEPKESVDATVLAFLKRGNLSLANFNVNNKTVISIADSFIFFYFRRPVDCVEFNNIKDKIAYNGGYFVRIRCTDHQHALRRGLVLHCAQECQRGSHSKERDMEVVHAILYAQGSVIYDKNLVQHALDIAEEKIRSGKKIRGFQNAYIDELRGEEEPMKKKHCV